MRLYRVMIEKKLTIDGRLMAAASFVRDGAVVADVGTDHAFLPISLIIDGRIGHAVASDINSGPLSRAKINSEKYGVSDKVEFVLVGGIPDDECRRMNVTDIVICGMGGELIESIISSSAYVKNKEIRLILQPMSFAAELRSYLCSEGFAIIDEKLCKAAGRIYTVICAQFDGIRRSYNDVELVLGKRNIENKDSLFAEYVNKTKDKLNTQIKGKTSGGIECDAEKRLLEKICGITEELK